MNYLLLFALLINILSHLKAMNILQKTPYLWVITEDKHLICVDNAIAQQSNLLTVLQEKYKATKKDPIPLKIDKEIFDFWCSHIIMSHQNFLITLGRNEQSKLMDAAAQLKCPIFYAQLMEEILTEKSIINALALKSINTRLLKKTIYKYFFEKIRIKKLKYHSSKKPIILSYSHNGDYFLENMNEKTCQINLWTTKEQRCIKSFPGYSHAFFSPQDSYIILYTYKYGKTAKTDILLYFMSENNSIELVDNHQNYSWYTATIHPNENYIIQSKVVENDSKYSLFHYIKDEKKIQKTSLKNDWNNVSSYLFSSHGNHIICTTKDDRLILYDLEKPNNIKDHKKFDNLYHAKLANINKNSNLLTILMEREKKLFFTIQDDKLIEKKCISSEDTYSGLKDIFISQKGIYCYNKNATTLCIMDENNKKTLLDTSQIGPCIHNIIADTTGNHIVSLHGSLSSHFALSTLAFWNISGFPDRLTKIKIDTEYIVQHMHFTYDGLLLTHGKKTELWDMEGDKILNLGRNQQYALHPCFESILVTKQTQVNPCQNKFEVRLFLAYPHTKEATACLNDIKTSLTLSQALLFNTYCCYRKNKKRTLFHPNLPDGRALASFKKEHKFLINNFKLIKQDFIPTSSPILQPEKLLAEQS